MAIYGDSVFMLDSTHFKIPKTRANPKYRMPFCHQSVFVKTSLLKKYKFDTSFKICADNDFFTKIYNLENARFFNSKEIVSIYDANGISSTPSARFFLEEMRIIAKYNKFYMIIFCAKFISMKLKYFIKSILPRGLSLKIQSKYNAKTAK